VFTLRGRGLPRVNASGAGDLHVRVQVWSPKDVSPEVRKLLEKLQDVQEPPPATRAKGFWAKMKEVLGA
jgi:molecular chaperone DnaJ